MSSEPFQINVVLHSEEHQSTQNEIVRWPTVPATFQEIQEKVEESFSIPACVQTLWIQECEIKDPASTTTSSLYLKSNDTIKVTHPSKGECSKVKEILTWLAECCKVLDEMKSSQNEEDVTSLTPQLYGIVLDQNNLSAFGLDLFSPTSDKIKQMNISHFESLNGTELLAKFHESIIFIRKNNLFESLHSITDIIEMTCCIAFTILSKFEATRRKVIDCGGLNTCIETFLKSDADHYEDCTKFSLFAICNISDRSGAQLYISKQKNVIERVLNFASLPTLNIKDALVCLSLFLNLAECREAHINLFKEDIVEKIMQSVKMRRELSPSEEHKIELQVFKYYVGLLLAQMIMAGEVLLDSFPQNTLQELSLLMNEITAFASNDLQQYERKNGFEWDSFLSMLCLYEPEQTSTSKTHESILQQLSQSAIDILLLSLETAIWKPEHIDFIVKQGLLEYLVMLPWNVPLCSCERARRIVANAAKIRYIQPPSLSAISNAQLAKMKWGLKKLRDMGSISHLLSKISL